MVYVPEAPAGVIIAATRNKNKKKNSAKNINSTTRIITGIRTRKIRKYML